MRDPIVSLEDIDDNGKLRSHAAEEADVRDVMEEASGEESAAGSNPSPDEDVVEEIGAEVGITYADDEELRLGRKEMERDEHRWELDPASAEDYPERVHPHDEGPADPVRHMKHQHGERRRS